MSTEYATIRVSFDGVVCRMQLHRPDYDNTITETMVRECHEVLDRCELCCTVLVVEGLPDVFCHGADFSSYHTEADARQATERDPSSLYDLWTRMAAGPLVTVAHARGTTMAGGVGFVAASDIVIADRAASFGLTELLFGLYPAMVLPFLSRRVGHQRAHYMTLMTKPVTAEDAADWGLVDVCSERSDVVVSQHIRRLSKLPKDGVAAYKRFVGDQTGSIRGQREESVAANRRIFSDPGNLERIGRFVEQGIYPWERGDSASRAADQSIAG
ncbi:MAG: enoyl-CoA hydratase/isomerase [Pseudonocardiaceae bacterium]|nr:enoyl-CoA hydratase/isomerase [Pseudonocardiaceae bacterium]